MRKIFIVVIDFWVVLLIMIAYSNYITNMNKGTEFATLATGAGWIFIICLNILAYFLATGLNYFLKSASFLSLLLFFKFTISVVVLFFYIFRTSYESSERDGVFFISSLLVGGIIQFTLTNLSELKHFFKKLYSFFENIWKEK